MNDSIKKDQSKSDCSAKGNDAGRKCKVLLINGSPRKNGNTFLALSEAAKRLEKHGIETEIVQIGVKPVRGCIACGQCKAKQLGRCVFDDDICNRISEKLNDVDGLIVGSPVYYGQPNGSVLSLIQRMFMVWKAAVEPPRRHMQTAAAGLLTTFSPAEKNMR